MTTEQPPTPTIEPVAEAGDHRTGTMPASITPEDIEALLGFKPNIKDAYPKVTHSWGFTVDGVRCGIWDYKGSRWSVYDPHGVLPALFAAACAPEPKSS